MRKEFLIKITFSEDSPCLPTVQEIKDGIVLENDWHSWHNGLKEGFDWFFVREEYTKHSFCILSTEFCQSIVAMCNDLNLSNIVELCSGPGWLSFWLRRHGLKVVHTIDNGSWKRMTPHLKSVEKLDAISFVKEHGEVDLFILSWPYMDNVAFQIWENMRAGQYLLYIGEESGGCTADDVFFEAVDGKEVEDRWNLEKFHLSFFGIHDHCLLYKR